jgi:hypothetical protein
MIKSKTDLQESETHDEREDVQETETEVPHHQILHSCQNIRLTLLSNHEIS